MNPDCRRKVSTLNSQLSTLLLALLFAACGGSSAPEEQPDNPTANAVAQPAHDTTKGSEQLSIVNSQTSTMGKIVASQYADLSFETMLPIKKVLVRNGQKVHRGQVIAQLDLFKLSNAVEQRKGAVEQAQLQMEQASLQMQDVIISQGYDPDNNSSVPANVRHNASVKSGYALAKNQLAMTNTQLDDAQHALDCGTITAPFDGIVANLSVQAHQLAQPGQTVCRVIANNSMEVEFRVMETDLNKYKTGTHVTVIPVANKGTQYEATVSQINPVIDEQGAITIRAKLSKSQDLFDGMNVEIRKN